MSIIRLSIRTDASKKNPTATQPRSLQERRTALLKCLHRFQQLQTTFMPGLRAYLDDVLPSLFPPTNPSSRFSPPHSTLNNNAHPEEQPLYLPSGLGREDCCCVCIQGLPGIEEQLCEAHVMEGLQDLRTQLRMRSYMSVYKKSNIQSQGPYTRMRTLQQQVEQRVMRAATCYRQARAALLVLRGPGDWEHTWRELRPQDVRCMNEREPTTSEVTEWLSRQSADDGHVSLLNDSTAPVVVDGFKVGEGRRTLSWIWFSVGSTEATTDLAGTLHQSLRVEWAKCRAHALRWQEELLLLEEKMCRVLEFGRWHTVWWRNQVSRQTDLCPDLTEGLAAFAAEQAVCEEDRVSQWAAKWAPVRERAQAALHLMASGSLTSTFLPLHVDIDLQLEDEAEEEDEDNEDL